MQMVARVGSVLVGAEKGLSSAQTYPCTVEDLVQVMERLPADHLAGLQSVWLVRMTRKDAWTNGRYYVGPPSRIHLYAWPVSLSFRLPSEHKRRHVEHGLAVELAFGLETARVGARFECRWEKADLRRFILYHVLLHEIGHHVYYLERTMQGLCRWETSLWSREQYAEAYATRMRRRLFPEVNRPRE